MNLTYVDVLASSNIDMLPLEEFFHSLSPEILKFLYVVYRFILTLFSYLYIFIKFYKFLCYAKITCEWFPLLNPYTFPFSLVRELTLPYFRFWSTLLPSLKFQKASIEISGIIGLEALNAIIYFCIRIVNVMLVLISSSENVIQNYDDPSIFM